MKRLGLNAFAGLLAAAIAGMAGISPARAALFHFVDFTAQNHLAESAKGNIEIALPAVQFAIGADPGPYDFPKLGMHALNMQVNGLGVDGLSVGFFDDLSFNLWQNGKHLVGEIFINKIDVTIMMSSNADGSLWNAYTTGDNLCGAQTTPGCLYTGRWLAVALPEPGALLLTLGGLGWFAFRRRQNSG